MTQQLDRHFDASTLPSNDKYLIPTLESQLKDTLTTQPQSNKKIWKDRNLSKHPITLSLVQALEDTLETYSDQKQLTPFWNDKSKQVSDKLYLPSETDSKTNDAGIGKSWFTLQTKETLNTRSHPTKYALHNHLDQESFECKGKSRAKPKLHNPTGLKSLKIRLFPTKEEKEALKLYFEQFRWYYNAALAILYNSYSPEEILKTKWSGNNDFRSLVLTHEYKETTQKGVTFKEFIPGSEGTKLKHHMWNKVHSRLPRGAICKFTYALDATIALLKNGNIRKFEMKPKTKKDVSQLVYFEDSGFPKALVKIKSSYWLRSKDHKRACCSFKDIFESSKKRGLEVLYDEVLDRYTLIYPIEYSWFPENDLRTEKQSKYSIPGNKRVIALDPGLRKFLVGYDPGGKVSIIGEGAQEEIIRLLVRLDKEKLPKKEEHLLWNRIKCLVSDMHWKSINYLISNYDVILYPTFETSKMMRGKKLSKLSKRIMNMFSFFQFKSRLEWKCEKHGKTLIIVDESYTSKTCGSCGALNNKLGGSETFKCGSCDFKIDRDVNGARNILLKNMRLR